MQVIPFEAWHIGKLDVQSAQAYMLPHVTVESMKDVEGDSALTGIHDGAIVACAGVAPVYPGRALVWAYLSRDAGKCFMEIHREGKKLVGRFNDWRVEATVDCDFENGHRWIKALGFTLEAPRMRRFGIDGRDVALYAKVG